MVYRYGSLMTVTGVKRRLWLIRRWDMCCVICGEEFPTLSTVTFEHIMPASMGGTKAWVNIAPSHYNCNKWRKTMSLLDATRKIEVQKAKMGKQFFQWISKSIPHVDLPACAFLPVNGIQITVPASWTGGDQYAH